MSVCKACQKNMKLSWRSRNRERENARFLARRNGAPKLRPGRVPKGRTHDHKAYMRRMRQEQPERLQAYYHTRRGRELAAGPVDPQLIVTLWRTQEDRCYYCKTRQARMQLEHKQPLSRGGTNDPTNLCLACAECNRQKGTKTEAEYVAYRKHRGVVERA